MAAEELPGHPRPLAASLDGKYLAMGCGLDMVVEWSQLDLNSKPPSTSLSPRTFLQYHMRHSQLTSGRKSGTVTGDRALVAGGLH